MSNKLLITGSEGLIGKILVKNLKNYDIIKLDQFDVDNGNYIKVDISDYELLKKKIEPLLPINTIIHLAADHRVNADWDSVVKNNIIGTKNIYELAKNFKIRKVIYFSSNHVTGGYEGFPPRLHRENNPEVININHPIRPDGYYATSKVFGESIARQFHELYDIDSICLRIGSVLKDDNPTKNKRFMKTWLSHLDLIQLTEKSIISKVKFGIYYGVSDNTGRFWEISNAFEDLKYLPIDNAKNRIK